MKYIAAILCFMLMVAMDSCENKGVYWTLDGQRHTFMWGIER